VEAAQLLFIVADMWSVPDTFAYSLDIMIMSTNYPYGIGDNHVSADAPVTFYGDLLPNVYIISDF
jgi:hypothetical protein